MADGAFPAPASWDTQRSDMADPVPENVVYWLKGERVQNFGDFTAAFLMHRLFAPELVPVAAIYLLGSALADFTVPPAAEPGNETASGRVIYWGCGLRDEAGLPDLLRPAADILAVRGPLTRSVLKLGESVPIGDPGLLLPVLHSAPEAPPHGAVLVPHFHEQRPDSALIELSGCDRVLRPNLSNDVGAIGEFLDRLLGAEFALCGSLHAAIARAAYGRPFAYWDGGTVDLPFKWQDFSASVSVPCEFHTHVEAAREHWALDVAPRLRLPALWPLLAVAPFPVQPDAFLRTVAWDVDRLGPDALRAPASFHVGRRLALARWTRTREIVHDLRSTVCDQAQSADRLQAALSERANDLAQLRRQRDGEMAQFRQEAVRFREEAARFSEELAIMRSERDDTWGHVAQLDRRIGEQATHERHLLRLLAERAEDWERAHQALDARARDVARLEAAYNEATNSASWRLTSPLRAISRDTPSGATAAFRRAARLAAVLARGKLPDQLRRRRRKQAEIVALQACPLFDEAFYRAQHPAITPGSYAAAAHYALVGAYDGSMPNAYFDSHWYFGRYPDVARAGENPLLHWLGAGVFAGYDPNPLFDTDWYCRRNPDVTESGLDPLSHWIAKGAAELRDPNPMLDARAYLIEYPAARDSGLDPLLHWWRNGGVPGVNPHPLFDSAWYRSEHGLPKAADPLAHWLAHGRAAGMRTSPIIQPGLDPAELAFPSSADPAVTIIIPVYGHYADTVRCLYSVRANSGDAARYEVIVADDHPNNPTVPLLEERVPGIRCLQNPRNLGFLRNCNAAAGVARGRYLVFLNNDTVVHLGWLDALVRLADEDPAVAMVGCKLLNPNGTLQEAGGMMPRDGWGTPYGADDDPGKPEYNFVRDVDIVIGACFLVRRETFERLGGFDDRYAPAFYEEFDLAFAFRNAGMRVLYQPASVVTHHGSTSYGAETRDTQSLINHGKFCAKWRTALVSQPARAVPEFRRREPAPSAGTMLIIDDGVPRWDRHAGALTIKQYIGLLRSMGFKMVFCPARDLAPHQPYTRLLQQEGVEVLHAPETLRAWLARNGSFVDYVWTARPDITGPVLRLLRERTTALIWYYTHDLHYLRERRRWELDGDARSLRESNRLRRLEHAIFAGVDLVMTPSRDEADIIRAEVPAARVHVIPPYLYDAAPAPRAPAPFSERDSVIFVGGYLHPPNVDAALWLAREIMPLVWRDVPEARLLVVGADATPELLALAGPRVDVTGFVPDVQPLYDRARISVNPLRYGAGVKGKIVASLAAGVPVVTTPIGNEGIGLRDGVEVLIGEDAPAIAARIVALWRDPARCAAIAQAGRAVLERYSVAAGRAALNEVMDDAPAQARSTAAAAQ